MSFRFKQKETFAVEVTVNVANDRGGYDKNKFVAKFKRATLDELTELRTLQNDDLVRRQMVDWELKDTETGDDVPFTKDNLEAALQITPTSSMTAMAFWEGANGARVKNL
jgi:hypothetical protein